MFKTHDHLTAAVIILFKDESREVKHFALRLHTQLVGGSGPRRRPRDPTAVRSAYAFLIEAGPSYGRAVARLTGTLGMFHLGKPSELQFLFLSI